MNKKRNPRVGSSLDDFLKKEGVLEGLQVQAIKEVVAWQLEEAMKKNHVSKARLAKLLRTSRTQVNRPPRSGKPRHALESSARGEASWSRGQTGNRVVRVEKNT